jgi:hypothetical protein
MTAPCRRRGAISRKKFAKTGVAGIISATIDLDDKGLSPLEYPKLSDDRLIAPLSAGVKEVQQLDCQYMIAFARPLLANPDLLKIFALGQNDPAIKCCRRPDATSGAVPSQDAIERQIIDWSRTMATVPSALEGYL